MQVCVHLSQSIPLQQPILPNIRHPLRRPQAQPLPVDAAIDHHVRHVHALRPELARKRLRHRAQRSAHRVGRIEAEIQRALDEVMVDKTLVVIAHRLARSQRRSERRRRTRTCALTRIAIVSRAHSR